MKTFFKSILAVAVCASLFAACSKDDTVSDPSNGRKVTMTVTNLASAESVLGVKFTAPDKKVTGRSYVDMTAGTIKEYGYINNFADNVTLNYSSEMNITANSEAGMTAYFTCFPFEVAAGETFTVTVTTATKIFTKTVTVQEGRALAFAAGDSSTFAVDMTDAAEETTETLSGDYVITATQSEITYAMSSLADGSRLAPVVITPSNPYKTGDETLIWTITKSGDNYTISQGENYLSWESDNSATTSTTPYELVITKNKSEGTYQIASAATPSRILAKNTQAAYGFGFYTGSQTKDLTLIPAEYVKLPQITLDQTTLTLSYNDTETHYIPVTLKNAETQDVSVAIYDGTEGTEQPDWITTGDYNGSENRLEVAATENTVATPRTARIVLTATTSLGTANATLLITQNSKPEGGVGETWTYTFKSADKDKIAAGLTVNGLTWTASKAPTAFDQNNRGLSWSKPSGVTIKTSDYTGGIKKITLVMSANTANLSTVNATVGGQALGETISLAKTNNQEYVVESETPLSGEIVLTLNTESGGKSLMIKTITIN